jgi:glycosyltransferase involved in cell wall biosynthesis
MKRIISEQLRSIENNKNFVNKVIIVDDFSTDNTYEKIKSFKKNIRYPLCKE